MTILVGCACGKQFSVKDELAGKRGKCPTCGQALTVPPAAPPVPQRKGPPPPPAANACPTCREALKPNAVICLNCGLDLRTGKQLPAATSSFDDDKPFKPSAKSPAPSSRLWLALIAGGVCVAGVAGAVFILTRGKAPEVAAVTPASRPDTKTGATAVNPTPGPVFQPPGFPPNTPAGAPPVFVPPNIPNGVPPAGVPPAAPKAPAGVVVLSGKFVDAITIRLPLGARGQDEEFPVGAAAGKRLLWAEIKFTQPGRTAIDLKKLRAVDGAGGLYPVTGFKVGFTRDTGARPLASQILQSDGLKGAVIPKFSGGAMSTESDAGRIEASPDAVSVTVKSGEAFASFFFVVPAEATDITLRDFAGGDVPLGNPGGR